MATEPLAIDAGAEQPARATVPRPVQSKVAGRRPNWKSLLFWKLLLVYAGLNLATTAGIVWLVSSRQAEQHVEQVRQRLESIALVTDQQAVAAFAEGEQAALQRLADRVAGKTKTRVTLVAMDGTVLADSEESAAAMENHRQRPELLSAAEAGTGMSQRFSPTLKLPMLYFASRADHEGLPVGLVRVATPMQTIQQDVWAVQRLVWQVAVLISLVTVGLTYVIVGRILQPVQSLTEAADAIAAGEEPRHLDTPNRDELGTLARAFNQMSARLGSRLRDLKHSSERLSTVLESMTEGVVAVDARQRILFANTAACELLDFDASEVEGRPLLEQVRHHRLDKAISTTLREGVAKEIECEMEGPPVRVLSVYGACLPGDPPPGAVLVLHDVTGLRRLENLRHEFVANVSHELKTPLSSIKAYSETLLDGALDDKTNNERFVQQIADQAERLYQLILDLLSLARIESGSQTFEIVTVAAGEIVMDCLAHHAEAAAAKRIALATEPPEATMQLQADEEGLVQILNNLLSNAINYTPDGGRVTVRWRAEGDRGVIEVADTGIGIAPEDQARVFERFYRVDKARSRELGGTGLGLAIVKHLTHSFGGEVDVESTLGEGCTFRVRLPLAS